MSQSKDSKKSYQELSEELEAILLELQRDDLDVELALSHYERGLAVIKKLENYLSLAENKVKTLKAQFNKQV